MRSMRNTHWLIAVSIIVGLLGAPNTARTTDGDDEPPIDHVDCSDEVAEYQQQVKACLEAANDLQTAKKCWELKNSN